ncbi:DNA polymerase III subunit gamma/tau [Acinetobacter puyangensis]|uniref:DNA polymerase III subunit gamma/tau n=1 Tax=Acinetobacter puyangensis TaxID=1096779 RepID=A0A240E5U4_9GAMM|nr:DNA polymerase III subunit gamma/tau [Acinetobacter puyangensis]SNX44128.1 DNA polymerase-3 subunit gamma/tau [Acinetobacter puyangensis]
MYQVLARKYRPRNFSQLVGQTHVAKALSSALANRRLHHAYLFTGTRGVGKTTIARILAKCLNCETGVTATPCEQCSVCKAVNEGRFIDLIEIDAASRTRVEDTRELLDNVPYAPTQGRYKVYLIDEVHMLSTHSFNALLKTLEEPPEHVKFLFATTDPQKLPITVISRCLQFTLRPLAKDEIFHHLDQILETEEIVHQPEALWQLAESAQGSLRDALSLTDQAIAYGQGQVLKNDVKEMLGLIDKSLIFDLLIAIHQDNRALVASLIQDMRQQAIDVMHVLEQLISTLHEVAIIQCLGQSGEQTQIEEEQRKAQLAQVINSQDVQLYYQIAIQGRADLALALTPEQGFEMCMMRLLAFRPVASGEVIEQPVAIPQSTVSQLNTTQELQSPQDAQANQDTQSISQSTAGHTSVSSTSMQPSLDEAKNAQVASSDSDLQIPSAPLAESHEIPDQQVDILPSESIQLTDQSYAVSEPMDVRQQTNLLEQTPEHQQTEQDENIALDSSMADQVGTNMSVSQDDAVEIEQLSDDSQHTLLAQNVLPSSSESDATVTREHKVVQQAQQILPDDQGSQVETLSPENAIGLDQTIDNIDPRDLLQPQPQDLTGEWTVEKWDYWLRQSALSPAVKELAQHAAMDGHIEGACQLTIDPSYQRIFEAFVENIKVQLSELNQNLNLQVVYQTIEQNTPLHLQQLRKQRAYTLAEKQILSHPVVADLVNAFSADVVDLKFKS